MADASDVETALLTYVAAALVNLPLATEAGTLMVTEAGVALSTDGGAAYVPGTVATAATGQVRMYRGWPTSTGLAWDIPPPPTTATPTANVCVQIDAAMSANTTRYLLRSVQMAAPPPTLLLTAANNIVVVSGTPAVGQVCGLRYGPQATAVGVSYRVQAGDTPVSIAAILAALVPGATASDVLVTMPTDLVTPRVVQDATVQTEVRRQEAVFRISVFAPSPSVRDALAGAIDLALAQVSLVTLPDGSVGYVRYARTMMLDASQQVSEWRRDLLYHVEYPTVVTAAAPEMLFGVMASGPGAPINA